MKNPQNWYVRRDNKLKGPFPAGLVSRYLLLGRFRETDEVSTDREQWRHLFQVDELIPEVMREARAHPDDPEVQERLKAAKRWADERREPHAVAPDHERRQDEPLESINLRASRTLRAGRESSKRAIEYVAIFAVVAVVVGTPFLLPEPANVAAHQCERAPGPGVEWNSCLMPGRDLANADLTGAKLRSADLSTAVLRGASLRDADMAYASLTMANLRGANLAGAELTGTNLRGANLANANLTGADLSYAVLSAADLTGADLTGARLDHAQWGEGIECLPGSVGACQPGQPKR
jgi:hypothetical protein